MSRLFDVEAWKQIPLRTLEGYVRVYTTRSPGLVLNSEDYPVAMVKVVRENIDRKGQLFLALDAREKLHLAGKLDPEGKDWNFEAIVDYAKGAFAKVPNLILADFPKKAAGAKTPRKEVKAEPFGIPARAAPKTPIVPSITIPGLGQVRAIPQAPIRPILNARFHYDKHGYNTTTVQQMIKASYSHPNQEALKRVLEQKLYGTFDIGDLLFIYQINLDLVRASIGSVSVEPFYAVPQLLARGDAALKQYAQDISVLAEAMRKGESLAEIKRALPGHVIEYSDLPAIAYGQGPITITGGLGGLALPAHELITYINLIPTVNWSFAYSKQAMPIGAARKIAYLLSRSPIPVKTVDPGRDMTNVPVTIELIDNILNLPEIYEALLHREHKVYTPATVTELITQATPPHNVSIGGEEALIRYIARHPKIKEVKKPQGMPYRLEDYIPDNVWNSLPVEITRTGGPVLVPGNPYDRIPDWWVLLIASDRGQYPAFEVAKTVMFNLDEVEPEWKNTTLRSPIDTLSVKQCLYYMAARGITVPYFEEAKVSNQGFRVMTKVAVGVTDAGGLGEDEKGAQPNRKGFLHSQIAALAPVYIEIICRILNIPDWELVNPVVLQRIVERGYINPLPLDEKIAKRHEIWKKLTPLQKAMLSSLYGVERIDVVRFCNTEPRPKSIEHYILSYSAENLTCIIKNLGIYVPPNIRPDEYVTQSLHLYDSYLNRRSPATQVIAELSDTEILKRLNAYPPYQSRGELVAAARSLLAGNPGFFITFPNNRNCLNEMTIDFVSETKDETLFLISYGTLQQYYCYEISDIWASLNANEEGQYKCRLPLPSVAGQAAKYQDIPRANVNQAQVLVMMWKDSLRSPDDKKNAEALLLNIVRINDIFEQGSVYDAELFKQFVKEIPLGARPLIQRFFHQLFELGMYARRWKGPPNPYVMTDKESWMDQCFVPEVATAEPNRKLLVTMKELGEFKLNHEAKVSYSEYREVKEKKNEELVSITKNVSTVLEWVMAVHTVEHIAALTLQQAQIQGVLALSDTWSKQFGDRRGHTCIRIGSRTTIGTGYYYLLLLFKESIKGYDPTKLEKIV